MTLAEHIQHIDELAAEIRGALTRRERNAVRAELTKAIAAQAEIERAAAAHDQSVGGDHMPKVLNARQAGTKPAADRVYVGRPSRWVILSFSAATARATRSSRSTAHGSCGSQRSCASYFVA